MKIPGSNWANEELSGIIRYAVMLCKRPVMLCWWCRLCAMSCGTLWRDFQSPKVWTLLLVSASRDLFLGRSVFLALLEEEAIRHAEVVSPLISCPVRSYCSPSVSVVGLCIFSEFWIVMFIENYW